MEIQLTKGYVAHVDPCDYAALSRFKWYAIEIRRRDGSIYSVRAQRAAYMRLGFRQYKTTRIWMHREILGFPDGDVDHKDADGLNNRRSNLRQATKSQNMGNRRKLNVATSGFKGVYWYPIKQKWHAAVSHQKKRFNLGYHATEIAAARAYNEAALRLHGEFARINEIPA